jgi:hypothetical protein
MHIASHAGVNVEKNHCAGHASDIPLYTSISTYILVYDVSYNLTPHFTLIQARSALRLRRVSAPRFIRASPAWACLTVVCSTVSPPRLGFRAQTATATD